MPGFRRTKRPRMPCQMIERLVEQYDRIVIFALEPRWIESRRTSSLKNGLRQMTRLAP